MTVNEIPADRLTISAAAELSGLSVDTLRYYEKEGLTLQRPQRSSSGQRRYTQQNVTWLATLVMLRKTGMPIRDMKRFVELYRQKDNEPQWLAFLETHRLHVLEQLDEAQTHLAAINKKIDYYETKVIEGEMSL
jgi:DNA-binding transcriptional MerR regulator